MDKEATRKAEIGKRDEEFSKFVKQTAGRLHEEIARQVSERTKRLKKRAVELADELVTANKLVADRRAALDVQVTRAQTAEGMVEYLRIHEAQQQVTIDALKAALVEKAKPQA